MNSIVRLFPFACVAAVVVPAGVYAETGQPSTVLDAVVVTAPPMKAPLEVSFDPRSPQQPLPANDGGSLLKTIPGMSLIRKGGTDGDPVFRGMAASRLNILLDGEHILGGCGMRMDPPTAYIFPDTYDKVTIIKGPQTVLYGPGASAGTVLFERKPIYFSKPGWAFQGALTGASFGRHDEFANFKAGNELGYVQGTGTYARAGDYRDGGGDKVHSEYRRWSTQVAAGWTPDRNTTLEFSAGKSDGRAAYADRAMDGTKFERENYGLKFEKRNISGLLNKIEAQAYYNYIDHVMNNYSMRPLIGKAMLNNPDRETVGGRFALTLLPGENTQLVLGADYQQDDHTIRNGVNYRRLHRVKDASFTDYGVFGELTQHFDEQHRVIAGLRYDRWESKDRRRVVAISGNVLGPNPTAGKKKERNLGSGFIRYEQDFAPGATLYAGLGQATRAPDYWELINKEGAQSLSVFDSLKPEKTRQLDVGMVWNAGPLQAFVSGFYARVDDYILIRSNYAKSTATGKRMATIARNIDAVTWGGEAGVNYQLDSQWAVMASLAYVHGRNDTDHHDLGQMPPLEGRFGLSWEKGDWFAGSLLRVVSHQNRYALNEGNIVGQDLGPTGGFAVFSLNGGYRWDKSTRITFGVDNLFDRKYAEAISRTGTVANLPGFEQTTRVNEPGRIFWLKAQIALE